MKNLRKSIALLAWIALSANLLFAADPDPERSAFGMVVTPEGHASRIGVEVLEDGGTAADAAVAVAFALAVTNPQAGNLGGGGFLLFRDADGGHHAIDFRETAPAALTADKFLGPDGKPVQGLSLETGLAVGTPGSVAGLAEIHRRWGVLPWRRLVEPARRLARDGFVVYPDLERAFRDAEHRLRLSEETRRVFLRNDDLPRAGQTLRQPDLSRSLKQIARRGPRAFYEGPIAESIVSAVRAREGVMTLDDLGGYRVVDREPVRGSYRGYEVVSFPPPSSGGVILLQMLAMLERFELSEGYGASSTLHLLAEIQRRAYADRSRWLGDPDHYDVPTEELMRADYVDSRVATIDPARATMSEEILPGEPTPDHHDTLHFSIADNAGRAVSLTTTLNTNFGSGIVADGTGIMLNNEIDDFSLAPGVPNTYGLVGGEANAILPLKRPLSSMTPTIVETPEPGDRPFLILGSPGGGRIINAVLQVLVNVVDHGMSLEAAVNAPRIHHQWLPDRLYYEPRSLPADVMRALAERGHEFKTRERIGNVNAIGVADDGDWLGSADLRRGGAALGQR